MQDIIQKLCDDLVRANDHLGWLMVEAFGRADTDLMGELLDLNKRHSDVLRRAEEIRVRLSKGVPPYYVDVDAGLVTRDEQGRWVETESRAASSRHEPEKASAGYPRFFREGDK